jgi:hypothetical protein
MRATPGAACSSANTVSDPAKPRSEIVSIPIRHLIFMAHPVRSLSLSHRACVHFGQGRLVAKLNGATASPILLKNQALFDGAF